MVKHKKRGKQSFVSKAVNIGGILIGLSGIIKVVIDHGMNAGPFLMSKLTFGLSKGLDGFNLSEGLEVYAPVGAAIGYRKLTTYLIRRFPMR